MNNNRERQRYIYFKIIKNEELIFQKNEFLNVLWKTIWDYFGMNTANKIGLWLSEFNLEKGFGIIRCSHQTKEIVISALSLIKIIKGKRIIFSPIKTSGSLKKIKNMINN